MRSALLALRALRREWRSGELALLWLSLTIAISALTAVGFLVDRIGRAVTLQASEILAADLRVQSDAPIAPAETAEAQRLGLRTAAVTTMLSAIFRGDASRLADVRAVSSGYPLRGQLQVAEQAFAVGAPSSALPAIGEVWPDSRLAATLGARLGSELAVGARTLRVTRILISRPDQNSTFVDFLPTLLMNAADLPASQLIAPGSRVNYALLLAGGTAPLQRFRSWFEQHAPDNQRLADIADASPQIGDATRRAGRFLALASLVAVLLCAVAIALSARSYVRRHLDAVALMKTLGATRAVVLAVALWQLAVLAAVAGALGAGIGWLAQLWLVHVLRGFLRSDLPQASVWPALIGFGIALGMLAGFALPSLLQLTRVPALRVLRRDVGPPAPRLWAAGLPVALALVGVVYATLEDWRLSGGFIGGLAAAVCVLAIGGAGLLQLASRIRGYAGSAWRYGIARLARQRAFALGQIVALGLGVMLLLALAILRSDLVTDWRASLPADVPNYFFINIPSQQREAFQQLLQSQGARLERMSPVLRGRLTAINGQPVEGRHWPSTRGRELANREQNLTWTDQLGEDNRIVAGHWWTRADTGKPLVSLAVEYQQAMGLRIGDQLRFAVAGEDLTVSIASFRAVQWDSFRPNFFVVFPPGLLDGAAGTYLTSAYFSPSAAAMADLVHRFPGVSVFNVGDLLAQARSVIDKAITAVQSVFVFTVLAGLTVLWGQVQATREERRQEMAIIRVLGARRTLILSSVVVEFALLGALAGVLGASAAALAGRWLAFTLELNYRFDAVIWGVGVLGSMLIAVAAGVVAMRPIVRASPRALLS